VIIGGCTVALVAFADTSVLSRIYAAKTKTHVDPNQEMIGLGAQTWRLVFSRDFRSAAVLHAHPLQRPQAQDTTHGVVGAVSVALLCYSERAIKKSPQCFSAVVISSAIGLLKSVTCEEFFAFSNGNSGCRSYAF
jgi:MFS superfamily sulfate permease-like transporter